MSPGTLFKRKEKIKDNRGFSLVELIVAITILAVVVIPTARLFSSSVRMNMISKRRMNAVTLAEDTMEGIKANTLDQIAWKFNYPDNFDLINKNLFAEGADSDSIMQVNGFTPSATAVDSDAAAVESEDSGATYTFRPSASGKYYFRLKNVDVQDGKEKYDALIQIDASPYSNTGVDDDPKINFNSAELSEVATVKGKHNTSFVDAPNKNDDVLINMAALAPGYVLSTDNLYRYMTVSIVKVGSTTSVKLTNVYQAKVGGVVVAEVKDPENYELYSGSEGPIENIFFFYNPMYESRAGDIHDNITIDNSNGVDVNVYIVKQEIEPAASLQVSEATYRVNISDVEPSFAEPYHTKILTNVDQNLAAAYFDAVSPTYNQGNFLIKTNPAQTTGTPAKDKIVSDLTDTTTQLRFFDVDIKVFRSDDTSGETVYEVKGSTME